MDRFFLAWLSCIVFTVLIFEISCLIVPFLNTYYYLLVKIVFCSIVGHWIFLFVEGSIFKKRVNPNKKAVFITGCDSGFGFQLAKRLDSKGYHVFAGCLFPNSGGATELKSSGSPRFCTVHIDVTQDDSVQNAKDFVEKTLGECELWAVVNNAGVYKGLSVELSSISDFVDTLQVNAFGQVRVTKAFLPLLRKSKGRILNVNSVAGRFSAPYMPCYAMSKFASVAFTECLRREMDASGIKVISIEPEFFETPMSDSGNLKKLLKTRVSKEESYDKKLIKRMEFLFTFFSKISSPNIHYVINAMEAGVSMQHPCAVYNISGNKMRQIINHCMKSLPDFMMDVCVRTFFAFAPFIGLFCNK